MEQRFCCYYLFLVSLALHIHDNIFYLLGLTWCYVILKNLFVSVTVGSVLSFICRLDVDTHLTFVFLIFKVPQTCGYKETMGSGPKKEPFQRHSGIRTL